MRIKMDTKDTLFYIIVYIIVAIAVVITLYPMILTLSISLSDAQAVAKNQVWLLPVKLNIDGYKIVLNNKDVFTYFGNSILYTVAGTAFNIVATCLAAYPLSQKTFFSLRKKLNFFIAFTMYFSGGLIPTYLLLTSLGFYNSRWVMIIPSLVSTYNVMICRAAFAEVPSEIIESAKLDGASEWRILIDLAIPLIIPTLAVLTLYYAVGHWNGFFTAMLYLSDKKLQPMQLYLRRVLIMSSTELLTGQSAVDVESKALNMSYTIQLRYVLIVVSMVPILIVYPLLQKYFVKGIMLGAIKA